MSSIDSAEPGERARNAWQLACRAAQLAAIMPSGRTGVLVSSPFGPARLAWLAYLESLLTPGTPFRRLPPGTDTGRMLGGLDLTATLSAGRPILSSGVLADANGGLVVIPNVERMPRETDAIVSAIVDRGGIDLQRDGTSRWIPTRFGVIALDESSPGEDRPTRRIDDRLPMRIDLSAVDYRTAGDVPAKSREELAAARARFDRTEASAEDIEALCATAATLGITGIRVPLMAIAVARANAALGDRRHPDRGDLEMAAALTLAWRATVLPTPQPEEAKSPDTHHPEQQPHDGSNSEHDAGDEQRSRPDDIAEHLVDTVRTVLPPDLLSTMETNDRSATGQVEQGRSGDDETGFFGSERIGTRRGDPRTGAQLSIYATLLAAAPRQRLREQAQDSGDGEARPATTRRLIIRPEDFRTFVKRRRKQALTIFAVDASGSLALYRLGEAKGAVELLLSECYVRRDQIALIAFRGNDAQILLPPTSALARAKRSLSILPAGGGTPLASGLHSALKLALASKRAGQTPKIVLLTDGRANVARDGAPGRARAMSDAQAEAQNLRRLAIRSLMIDTSPLPDRRVTNLAEEMGATYIALPRADAAGITAAIKAA